MNVIAKPDEQMLPRHTIVANTRLISKKTIKKENRPVFVQIGVENLNPPICGFVSEDNAHGISHRWLVGHEHSEFIDLHGKLVTITQLMPSLLQMISTTSCGTGRFNKHSKSTILSYSTQTKTLANTPNQHFVL